MKLTPDQKNKLAKKPNTFLESLEIPTKENISYQRVKPDSCKLNFKEKPWCEFMTSAINQTYGWCNKCKREYVLENAKFGENQYEILEGTWVIKKYDMFKAIDSYEYSGFFKADLKWANHILKDREIWDDSVIEYAENIIKKGEE